MSRWKAVKQIEESKIIIVEGKDEAELISALLGSLEISGAQVIDAGGKENLGNRIRAAFKEPAFEKVTHFAVMRDADADPNAARESALHWLRKHNLAVPAKNQLHSTGGAIKTSVWISPDNSNVGMLEDLFLRCVCDEPALELASQYVDALIERYVDAQNQFLLPGPGNLAKARAHAVLTATDGPIKSIGLAAVKGFWNCKHRELEGLRNFLTEAFN